MKNTVRTKPMEILEKTWGYRNIFGKSKTDNVKSKTRKNLSLKFFKNIFEKVKNEKMFK